MWKTPFYGTKCYMDSHVAVHILVDDVVSVPWTVASVYKRGKCYVNCLRFSGRCDK